MSGRLWAIDANIILQQGVRRLLCACIEHTKGQVFVPERALALATLHYGTIARRRARRMTRWEARHAAQVLEETQRNELVATKAAAMTRAFEQWAKDETLRNDGLWKIAPKTHEASRIVHRLFVAGIADEGSAGTFEEDAEVAAQALDAGCTWIASHNRNLLQGDAFSHWLSGEQAQGRLLNAAQPFTLKVDAAIEQMLGLNADNEAGKRLLAALAWEITRPDNPLEAQETESRLQRLEPFIDSLYRAGAGRVAGVLDCVFLTSPLKPGELSESLEALGIAGTLDRVRSAERRQARATRTAFDSATPAEFDPKTHVPPSRRER